MQRSSSSLPPMPPCHRYPSMPYGSRLFTVAKTVAGLLATVTIWERWQNPLPPFLSPLSYCFSDTKSYRWHGGTGGKGFQTYRPFGANIGSTYPGDEENDQPRPCEAARPRAWRAAAY